MFKQKIFTYKIIFFLSIFLIINISFAQVNHSPQSISAERYITDNNGNILINVNVWGHVAKPGNHLVYDGIDLATMLSVVGGPLPGAKLKEVIIYRSDDDEKMKYIINLDKFIKTGNRTEFIKILPNDTIVIEEKISSILFRRSTIFLTVLQMLNIYLQISDS